MPFGIPSVNCITDFILDNKKEITAHTDEQTYSLRKPISKSEEIETNRVIPYVYFLLDYVKDFVDNYYMHIGENHKTNYEDIYYVIFQVHEGLSGNFENPAIQPLINELERKLKFRFANRTYDLIKICTLTMNYIRSMVETKLSIQKNDFEEVLKHHDYLQLIKDIINSGDFEKVNIFTLNHDKILEYYFDYNGINFEEGFSFFGKYPDFKVFDFRKFNENFSGIYLYKLHGSIDWYSGWPEDAIWLNKKYIKPLDDTKDPNHLKGLEHVEGLPEFLIGTFNKMLSYNSPLYNRLMCEFSSQLDSSNRLIIAGYGFSDKGINTKLIDWFSNNQDNKAVIIAPDICKTIQNARLAIRSKFRDLRKCGRLKITEKGIEDADYYEVSRKLY